jgi:hypothetical protein
MGTVPVGCWVSPYQKQEHSPWETEGARTAFQDDGTCPWSLVLGTGCRDGLDLLKHLK